MIGEQPLILVPGRFMQMGLLVAMVIFSTIGGWAAAKQIWWLLMICWCVGIICAALWGHGACARMVAMAYPELANFDDQP
jgi:hypothetical protein